MATFQKGHKKVGGRKKGSLNKFNQTVAEQCAERGISAAQVLMDYIEGHDDDKKFNAAVKLMDYCYPKMSAVTLAGDKNNPLEISGLEVLRAELQAKEYERK